jgi:hypothetical protein
MTNVQRDNNEMVVFFKTYQPVFADPVSPLTAVVRRKSFSVLPRIGASNQILFDPRLYHASCVLVKFLKPFVKA